MYESNPYFYGTGRRKESVARVRVYAGTGKIIINDRDIDDYFGLETLKLVVRQPLTLTDTTEKFDIICRVNVVYQVRQALSVTVFQERFFSMMRLFVLHSRRLASLLVILV